MLSLGVPVRKQGLLGIGVLGLLLLLVSACGGDDGAAAPTSTTAPTLAPTATATVAPTAAPKTAPTSVPTVAPTATVATPSSGNGDLPAQGRDLFVNSPASVSQQPLWCSTCHKLDSVRESIGGIGPDLIGIGARGEAYLMEALRNPEGTIAEGFTAGLMTLAVVGDLTDGEVDALVAFLLTQ